MMLNLDNVTLLAICGSNNRLDETKKSMKHCMKQVNFAEHILFTQEKQDDFNVATIPRLDLSMYNQFCIEELNSYIKTDFCLIVQWDGFIIDTDYWSNEYLEYDYIGSPWKGWNFLIGNGGFCLRSKKFLTESSRIKYDSSAHIKAGIPPTAFSSGYIAPEDFVLCVLHRKQLLDNGIRFPSPELAYKFSTEHQGEPIKSFNREDITTYKSFGFHGEFNKAAMRKLHEN